MRSASGRENPVTMTELMEAGILQIDAVEEDTGDILLTIDWDKLKEYNEDIYLYFREAEMNAEMLY